MKALSGRQPWWHAILHFGKRIENRPWNTHYRGPILLHAAAGCTRDEYGEAMAWMTMAGVLDTAAKRAAPPFDEMVRGGIVGRARIVEVIPPGGRRANGELFDVPSVDLRWHMLDRYGFVLADVEPLPFVPCKGALGLFELNEDGTRPARSAA